MDYTAESNSATSASTPGNLSNAASSPPPSKFNPWMIFSFILLIVLTGFLAYSFGVQRKLPAFVSQQVPASSPEIVNNLSPFSRTSVPETAGTLNKIAYSKGEEVVVRILETGETMNTGIPVRWQDETAAFCQSFSWFPDGSKILAVMKPWSIYDFKSKKLEALRGYPDSSIAVFQISPSNRGVYFVKGSESGTWYYDFGSGASKLVSSYNLVSEESLSPDQKYLLLEAPSGSKDKFGNLEHNYFVYDLETGSSTKMSLPRDVTRGFAGDLFGSSWSPSSESIVFTYYTDGTQPVGLPGFEQHLGIYNIKTKESLRLGNFDPQARDAVYSPDGSYVIFENESGPQELWRVDSNGANPVKLVDKHVNFYRNPSWSPDSQHIVLEKFDYGVIVVDRDGKNLQVIDKEGTCPIWSPK